MSRINAVRACALGVVDGFLCGAAVGGLNELYLSGLARNDSNDVVIGNVIIDMRPPIAPNIGFIVLSCVLTFALTSYVVHRFWPKQRSSILVLWQVIGVGAFALLGAVVYLQTFLAHLAGNGGDYFRSLPRVAPFVCLAVVVIVSFIVGIVAESSAKLYTHS